jgi:tetratricopeptide (TPR) repeat protein
MGIVHAAMDLPDSVHDLLRTPLRMALVTAEIESDVGAYLSTSNENPDRNAAAVEHFLRVPDIRKAADTLLHGAESLLRKGLFTSVLRLIQAFDPSAISEAQFLALTLERCKALEGLGRIEEAFDTLCTIYPAKLDEIPGELQARYLYVKGRLLYHLGRYGEALDLVRPIADSGRGSKDPQILLNIARVEDLIGRIYFVIRDLTAAEQSYFGARETYRSLGNDYGVNKIDHRLALIKLKLAAYDDAERGFWRVERESRRLGDMKRLSYALHRRGEIRARKGDYSGARKLLNESIKIKKRMGHQRGMVYSYAELARVASSEGNINEANIFLKQALEVVLALGMPKEEAFVCSIIAAVRLRSGQRNDAENWLLRAQKIYTAIGLSERAREATLAFVERMPPDLIN